MSNSATPWNIACQDPLAMGFPRQKCWSGLPVPFPGDLPRPGIEPVFPTWQADSLPLSHQGSPCPWDSPGKNPGVGCHSLLQGIFPTQGSNPGIPHCRQILYHLSQESCKNTCETGIKFRSPVKWQLEDRNFCEWFGSSGRIRWPRGSRSKWVPLQCRQLVVKFIHALMLFIVFFHSSIWWWW